MNIKIPALRITEGFFNKTINYLEVYNMLKKLNNFDGYKGPVVVIVMDGIGISEKPKEMLYTMLTHQTLTDC